MEGLGNAVMGMCATNARTAQLPRMGSDHTSDNAVMTGVRPNQRRATQTLICYEMHSCSRPSKNIVPSRSFMTVFQLRRITQVC